MRHFMKLLISGGPGSGCTSSALKVGEILGLPVFDSDVFFHKPTDPPFQEQYSPDERRSLLVAALSDQSDWIVSGSIATWGMPDLNFTHGVLLNIPGGVRLRRLEARQRKQFGGRIDVGGDLFEEHSAFLKWAAKYETRDDGGRCLKTEQQFIANHCEKWVCVEEVLGFEGVVEAIIDFAGIGKIG